MTAAAEAFSALAQDTRLAVFRLLVEAGPAGMPAGDVARRLGVPHNTMSTHLGILVRAGLAASRRDGRSIIYAADHDGIRGLIAFMVQDCCHGRPELCAPLLHGARAAGCCAPNQPQGTPAVSDVTIYHNPACGTSRNVLGLIRNSGVEPRVVEYLQTPPSREELAGLIRRMGVPVRAVLREKGTPYAALGLDDPALTDDQVLDAMMAHPILINRPIVVTPLGVKLCRPSEAVLALLPDPQRGAFLKEDGAAVVDAGGRPVVGPAP